MNDRNRRSAAEVMANAARVVKAAVNIVRAAIAGGLHGAAAAAAKELLPTIIKFAVGVLIAVIVIPMFVISAMPNMFFGYETSEKDPQITMREQALSIGGAYLSLEDFEKTQQDAIITGEAAAYENQGVTIDEIRVSSKFDEEDLCWYIAINSVAHKQDLSEMKPEEVQSLLISNLKHTTRLESGELEYIFSVDIMNEGVDIPSLNQIIMLRRTDSAIVFVQQLGRGLRKCDGKEYTLVLDFIGNYQSNYLVPVALTGDKTYNKDRLRRLVQEGDSAIPGCSTVTFDRVAESRIYRAIDGGDFTANRFLKNEYADLRRKLGHIPSLQEFDRNGSIDPLLIFKKYGSYHAFLEKVDSEYTTRFRAGQCAALKYVSQKLANGKRSTELLMLKDMIVDQNARQLTLDRACTLTRSTRQTVESATAVLYGSFSSPKDFVSMVIEENGERRLTRQFTEMLGDTEFRRQILEAIDFGLKRNRERYVDLYENTNFVLNEKYTYEEICRLFNWEKNQTPQNLGGYFYDRRTNTYPVFINYDKPSDISESIQYEDKLLTDARLRAISKGHRSMNSPEIKRLQEWPGNGMKTYLFMRKNKNDKGGKEFYFLGEMAPTGEFASVTTKGGDPAVEIMYQLKNPIRQDIYEFMLSDLSEN